MSTDDIDATAAQFATDVLAFGAHPDDVEIFCGRTVIRLIEQGYRIGVVDLTRGELASLETPKQRAAEVNAASPMLGLHFRENVGMSDGSIRPAPLEKMVEVIEACDRFYGSMIGVSHSEPLPAPNALGLMDPVAQFRHNGCSEAHAFEGVR